MRRIGKQRMKNFLIAVGIVILLLFAGYQYVPNLPEQVDREVAKLMDRVTARADLNLKERHDSLLVISLNLRHDGFDLLALRSLELADSILPDQALTKGILGLYYLERERHRDVIKVWCDGAGLDSANNNLQYLSGMDTAVLIHIDHHMLESMFIDNIINARIEQGLYHPYEQPLTGLTEQKFRLLGAVNSAFFVTVLLVLLSIILRRLWRLFHTGSSKVVEGGVLVLSRTVRYTIMISSILRIGHFIAALFNFFLLGSDISEFIAAYVLEPENLADLFETNMLFVVVLGAIVTVQLLRKLR